LETIFHQGRLYIEIKPPPDAPWRLRPDGKGGWRRVDQVQTFRRADAVLGPLRNSAAPPPRSLFPPRSSRAPRRIVSGRDGSGGRDDGSGDDGDGSGSDPPAPPPPTPLAVLIARAEARALLWQTGAFDLAIAVDELEAEAEVSGLLAAIGQDEVDAIIAVTFAAVRVADGWTRAAVEYHAARGKRTLSVETAAEQLRGLMAEDISLDRAVYEISEAHQAGHAVAAATLAAAEYLIQHNDAERLRAWLGQHSAQARAAILRHFQQRKKALPQCQNRT
jgi:hypothetical protein